MYIIDRTITCAHICIVTQFSKTDTMGVIPREALYS